jgi:hypothetical protein
MYRLYYSYGDWESRSDKYKDFCSVENALDFIMENSWSTCGTEISRNDFYPEEIVKFAEREVV